MPKEDAERAARLADLELAFTALISLVREEYPAGRRLAEIAYIWGIGISDDQIRALDRLEEGEPYVWPNSR
jgi:hypothetical protein